jgi:hypothetical protein
MTDIPADHTDEPRHRSRAPVATEEPRPRHRGSGSGSASGETSPVGVGNGGANGSSRPDDDDGVTRAEEPDRGSAAGESQDLPGGRARVTWRHALAAGLACFALWLFVDSPTLLHSAQDAPLGTRRTVAIDVLRPIAAVSSALGVSHVVGAADRVIGHTGTAGSGVLQVEGVPVRHHRVVPRAPTTTLAPASGPSSSSVPAPSPTTTVTAPDGLAPLAVPTQSAPLRLLVVGDSLGIDFGQPLVNDLAATDVVSAVLDGHIDTGLSRPDYFDWQSELQRDLSQYQPQAVVVFIGANDPQNFMDGATSLSYGTPAWDAAYAKRVGAFMAAATGAGARVLWIGMPPMADPTLNAKMENLNSIDQSQATAHTGVTYFASWSVLANAQGQYTAFLPDATGNEVQVRDPDGTHLSQPGAQRLSQSAIAFMSHEWGINL